MSRRIRSIREELKRKHGSEYSQEKVAQRVGVSLKAYRAFETFREPNYERRRAIALALKLSEDHFEAAEITEEIRQIVREELVEIVSALRRVEKLLDQ